MIQTKRIGFGPTGVIFCAFFTFAAMAFPVGYGGGSGTPQDPYRIWTAEQLNEIGPNTGDYNKSFILMADLDLSGYDGQAGRPAFGIIARDTDPLTSGYQGTSFSGVFDGNGHLISNLTCRYPTKDFIGLFGRVGAGGIIQNTRLSNAWIEGNRCVGGFAGFNEGTVTRSASHGKISGTIGLVGGIAGSNYGTLSQCQSSCTVSSAMNTVGGLAGFTIGVGILNCYATGSVSGQDQVGGLVGSALGPITNCYSTGRVTGKSSAGGLIGYVSGSTVRNCFWDITTSGMSTSAAGKGKTTAEMKSAGTFIAYGYCERAWTIEDTIDYPRLRWEGYPGETIYFWQGEGTADDPYQVTTADELDVIGRASCLWDKHFVLMNDIDLSGYDGQEGRPWFTSIGTFSGFFDGKGHTLSRFIYPPSTSTTSAGLFLAVTKTGEIRNLHLVDMNISGSSGVGGIAATNSGKIVDCSVAGTLTGGRFSYYFGGIAGKNLSGGIIDSCSTSVVIRMEYRSFNAGGITGTNQGIVRNCRTFINATIGYSTVYVGGIAGDSVEGNLTACWASGTITIGENSSCIGGVIGEIGEYQEEAQISIFQCGADMEIQAGPNCTNIGGLAGAVWNPAPIRECMAIGTIGNSTGLDFIGGLIGQNWGGIIGDCYSASNAPGRFHIGGLVGYMQGGAIYNCFSSGPVSPSEENSIVGGLLGTLEGGVVEGCFWDTETSGQTTSGGGIGRTTTELKDAVTFGTWGYCPAWTIQDGLDYPRLAWENKGGQSLMSIPWVGSGTANDPYQIHTPEQFVALGEAICVWDRHFVLKDDIDLSGYGAESVHLIGRGSELPFSGVFDGDSHNIRHFTFSAFQNNVGLFSWISQDGKINDLELSDIHVEGNESVGGLAGYSRGVIFGCKSSGWIQASGDNVGGLVGLNDGTLLRCSTGGTISSMERYIGGLVGNHRGWIFESFSCSSVSSQFRDYVGGIVGYNSDMGHIHNCYTIGNVSGVFCIGGLVGYSDFGDVHNCFSASSVNGGEPQTGGLIGCGFEEDTEAGFWDIQISGSVTSGGGTGKTTAEMKAMGTFVDAGWDFVGEAVNGTEDIWRMCGDGISYPRLSWELSQGGDMDCPDGVGLEDLVYLAGRWMTGTPEAAGAADADGSGKVDLSDFEILAVNWMSD